MADITDFPLITTLQPNDRIHVGVDGATGTDLDSAIKPPDLYNEMNGMAGYYGVCTSPTTLDTTFGNMFAGWTDFGDIATVEPGATQGKITILEDGLYMLNAYIVFDITTPAAAEYTFELELNTTTFVVLDTITTSSQTNAGSIAFNISQILLLSSTDTLRVGIRADTNVGAVTVTNSGFNVSPVAFI